MAGGALQNCSSSNTCCALLCFTKIKEKMGDKSKPICPHSCLPPCPQISYHGNVWEGLVELCLGTWSDAEHWPVHHSLTATAAATTSLRARLERDQCSLLCCTGSLAARDTINIKKPCQSQLLAFFFNIFKSFDVIGKVRKGFYKPVSALYFPKVYTNNLERMRELSTAKLSVKHIAGHR